MTNEMISETILSQKEVGKLEILIEEGARVLLSLNKEEKVDPKNPYYYLNLSWPGAVYKIITDKHDENYLRELMPKIENMLKKGCQIKLNNGFETVEIGGLY